MTSTDAQAETVSHNDLADLDQVLPCQVLPCQVLPWWQSRLNLAVLAVGIAVLFGSLGWVIGHNQQTPDPNSTDIGFLQDMRWHHDQAVEIAFVYLNDEGIDPGLQTIAEEVLYGQSIEAGMMVQLLRSFGAAESNESDLAMAWMAEALPIDRMPGLASTADIDALQLAAGAEADSMFAALMTAHHQGGIHMAEYASSHAATSDVRTMARQMADSQTDEIAEVAVLLAASHD